MFIKHVEQESTVNVGTSKQEIEDDKLDTDNIGHKEEVNPYQNTIVNEFDRENMIA